MARACLDALVTGPNQDSAVERSPTLYICLRCRDDRENVSDKVRGGTRLAHAMLQADVEEAAVDVRGVHCISQCKRPRVVALSGPDRFTYIFGDLDPTRHARHVVEQAVLYLRSPTGFMARSDRPEPMRAGVLGRVPPLGWSGAAVETVPLIPSNPKEPR